MNLFRARAVKDVADVTRAIPVIDFGPAFHGEPGGLEAFTASREFHALPLEVKLALRLNENNIYNANYFHRKEFAGHPGS